MLSSVISQFITFLAGIDAFIHLQLSGILRRARQGQAQPPQGQQNPPPGDMRELPLSLDQLFLLNALGYAVLLAVFWFGPWLAATHRRAIDVLLVVYALAAIGAWFYVGMPNPMNLGYLSKAIEVLLALAALVHLRLAARPAEVTAAT